MRVMRDGCRLSVLSAITSTQQRLKLYNKVPNNVLVLYCGTVLTEDVKERQVGSAGSPVFACLSFLFTNSPPREGEKATNEKATNREKLTRQMSIAPGL